MAGPGVPELWGQRDLTTRQEPMELAQEAPETRVTPGHRVLRAALPS